MGVTAGRQLDVQTRRVDALHNVVALRTAGQVTLDSRTPGIGRRAGAPASRRSRTASGPDAARALARRIIDTVASVDATADYLAFPMLASSVDLGESPPLEMLRTVDQIPGPGPAFTVHDGSVSAAWDMLLDRAIVADLELSAHDRAELDDAERLLYADPESGEPSTALTTYHTLLEAWLDAEAARTEADSGVSAAATAAAEAAAARLETEGKRVAIERAISVVRSLGRRGPQAAFQTARLDRAAAPGLSDAADGSVVAECGFSPDLDKVVWTPIEVPAAALRSRSATDDPLAAVDLEGPLLSHVHPDGVSSISAEVAVVDVRRPWLDPTILTSRAWSLPPDVGAMSDGAAPPSGTLPAYISGLVLMRNVRTTRFKPAPRVAAPTNRAPTAERRPPSASARSREARARRRASQPGGTRRRAGGSRPTVRDHRTARPPQRPTRPAPPRGRDTSAPARQATSRVELHYEDPVIGAFVCVTVPRCPDPDPLLFAAPSGAADTEPTSPAENEDAT